MLWTTVSYLAALALVFAALASLLGFSRTAVLAIALSAIATMTTAVASPAYAKNDKGNNGGGSQASSERGNSGSNGKSGSNSASGNQGRGSQSTAARSSGSGGKGNGLLRALGLEKPKAAQQRTTKKAVVTKRKAATKAKVQRRAVDPAQTEVAAAQTDVDGADRKGKKAKTGVLGAHPSALGALNAAHASEQALANANPNSRVGRIAAYRNAVLETEAQREDLAELQDLLDGLEAPDRSLGEIDAELALAQDDLSVADALVASLEADLAAAEGDPEAQEAIQADLDLALDAQMAASDTLGGLEAELADAQTYVDTQAEIAELEGEIDESADAELDLLEAAANKPVTDPVVDEVRRLLGLPPVDRTEDEVSETAEDTEELDEVASGDL